MTRTRYDHPVQPLGPFVVALRLGMPCAPSGVARGRSCPWHPDEAGVLRLHGWIRPSGQATSRTPVADLWHEIGHWLTASDAARLTPGFGAGVPYDYGWEAGKRFPYLQGTPTGDAPASAIGVMLHAYYGRTWDAERHARTHSWGVEFAVKRNPVALHEVHSYLTKAQPQDWYTRAGERLAAADYPSIATLCAALPGGAS